MSYTKRQIRGLISTAYGEDFEKETRGKIDYQKFSDFIDGQVRRNVEEDKAINKALKALHQRYEEGYFGSYKKARRYGDIVKEKGTLGKIGDFAKWTFNRIRGRGSRYQRLVKGVQDMRETLIEQADSLEDLLAEVKATGTVAIILLLIGGFLMGFAINGDIAGYSVSSGAGYVSILGFTGIAFLIIGALVWLHALGKK